MFWNFSWCEIQRNLIPCERNEADTASSSTIKWPPNSWIRQWIWFIRTRPSQSSPTSHKATQGLSALGQSAIPSQSAGPFSSPLAPPQTPQCFFAPLPGVETAPLQPPAPQYSFCPTKEWQARESQARPSTESINHVLIHMFQEVPNSYWEAMNSLDKDKWLKALTEKFEGLTKMGIWKLVDRPSNCKTIKLLEYPSKLYISWLTDNDLGIFSINWCYIFTYISDVFTSCDVHLIRIFVSCSHLIFIFKTEMWVSLVLHSLPITHILFSQLF